MELTLFTWSGPVVSFLANGRFSKLRTLALETEHGSRHPSLSLSCESFPQLAHVELREVSWYLRNDLLYSPVSTQLESLKVLGE